MRPIQIAIPIELDLSALPNGIEVTRSSLNLIEFSASGRNWPIYVITAATTVSLNLFSQFLYEAIVRDTSPPPKSIKIEEEEIIFDKGEIERSLKRTISVQQ
jgi:hypothetical protein